MLPEEICKPWGKKGLYAEHSGGRGRQTSRSTALEDGGTQTELQTRVRRFSLVLGQSTEWTCGGETPGAGQSMITEGRTNAGAVSQTILKVPNCCEMLKFQAKSEETSLNQPWRGQTLVVELTTEPRIL